MADMKKTGVAGVDRRVADEFMTWCKITGTDPTEALALGLWLVSRLDPSRRKDCLQAMAAGQQVVVSVSQPFDAISRADFLENLSEFMQKLATDHPEITP